MFSGSALAVGGALAAAALLYAGVKELLTFNPKGVVWGAVLIGGAVAVAGFAGVADGEAVAAITGVLAFALDLVRNVAATITESTGIDPLFVWLALGLLAFFALRGGGKKK